MKRSLLETALIVAALGILVTLMYAFLTGYNEGQVDARRDRACKTLPAALKLAAQRAAVPATADAARDLSVVLAPWVELCTNDQQLRRELETLASDHDRYRNVSTLTRAVAVAEAAQ